MKILLLIIFFNGGMPAVVQQDFENMRACQDAKTVIVATSKAAVTQGWCLPLQ